MGRAIAGGVVGYIVWTVLWLGGNAGILAAFPGGMDENGAMAEPGVGVAALVLSVICSLAGGAVCAAIATKPTKSVMVLAILLLLTGIGVQASSWDLMPIWFHIPFLLLLVPATLAGGRLAGRGGATAVPAT